MPPRTVRQIKTDCLVLQPTTKLIPKLVAMRETRHCDLADLVQTHMGAEDGQRRLDEAVPLARGKDETPVFRWTRGPQVKTLQGHYREPELDVPAPFVVPPGWTFAKRKPRKRRNAPACWSAAAPAWASPTGRA